MFSLFFLIFHFLILTFSYRKSSIKISVKVQLALLINPSKNLITSVTRVKNDNNYNIQIIGNQSDKYKGN